MLGKLLMDYTSSIAPSTSNIIVRILNVSLSSTRACINLMQSETYVYVWKSVTNIVNHEKTCSFCQKPEYLHVVNYSAIAQLRDIKSTQ